MPIPAFDMLKFSYLFSFIMKKVDAYYFLYFSRVFWKETKSVKFKIYERKSLPLYKLSHSCTCTKTGENIQTIAYIKPRSIVLQCVGVVVKPFMTSSVRDNLIS